MPKFKDLVTDADIIRLRGKSHKSNTRLRSSNIRSRPKPKNKSKNK